MSADAFIYFAALAAWSATIAYLLLFRAMPYLTGKDKPAHAAHPAPHAPPHHGPARHGPRRTYSTHEGFRSFAKGDELTIEDIVKGLAKGLD